MPTAGQLEHLEFPDNVRVDSGVSEGDAVTVHYDPMIAKLLTTGAERAQAIRLLDDALTRTHIGGLCSNVQFVRSCLQHAKFQQGELYTDFIADHQEELLKAESGQSSDEGRIEGALAFILLKVIN